MDFFPKKNDINPVNAYFLTLSSKFSINTYYSRLSIFCDFFFKTRDFNYCDWSTLDHIAILKYMRFELHNDKAHTTINLSLSALKGVAYECWQQKLIDIDCYMRIKLIKKIKGTRAKTGRVLSIDEIEHVKTYFSKHSTKKDVRNYAVFSLACGGGLRRRELLLLNVSDIKDNSVIVNGKGNKSRVVQLSTFVSNAVNAWLNTLNRSTGALFSKIDRYDDILCNRISSMGIGCIINQIIKDNHLKHFTPHDLRRTFATTLLNSGADQLAVQRLMGHSSLNTTAIYDMRGEAVKLEAIKLLPF